MDSDNKLSLPLKYKDINFKKPDTILYASALLYVILPIIIFLGGWTKLPIFLCGTALLLYTGYKLLYAESTHENHIDIITADNKTFWITTSICICVWVYLSGIGGFSYQNEDFWVRNPIYNDLCNMKWPVYFDLSQEPEHIRQYLGSDTVAFSYYYAWWLTPALICKIFRLPEFAANVVLYLHAVIGMLLLHYLLCKIMKKCSWLCTTIFVFFSGLDVVMYLIKNQALPDITQHLEWACYYFQYSGNTTQLFWVFNQSIPVWIITAIILSAPFTGKKYCAAIGSLSLAYSPWATFGIIPIVIYDLLRGDYKLKDKIKNIVTLSNICIPLLVLLVFGLFYMAGGQASSGIMFYFYVLEITWSKFLMNYFLFFFTEVGVYLLAMGSTAKNYPFYDVVVIELAMLPFFILRDNNFIMRASIPALFILMIFVIKYLLEKQNNHEYRIRKIVLIILLVIGARTTFNEINRSINITANNDDVVNREISSFSHIESENENRIYTANSQFFVHDYGNQLFFKYIGKSTTPQ